MAQLRRLVTSSHADRPRADRRDTAADYADWMPYQRRGLAGFGFGRPYGLALLLLAVFAGGALVLLFATPAGGPTPAAATNASPTGTGERPWISANDPRGPAGGARLANGDLEPYMLDHRDGRLGVRAMPVEIPAAPVGPLVPEARPPVVLQYELSALPEWSDPTATPPTAIDLAADGDLALSASLLRDDPGWAVELFRYDPATRAWRPHRSLSALGLPAMGPDRRCVGLLAALDGARIATLRVMADRSWSAAAPGRTATTATGPVSLHLELWYLDPVLDRPELESSIDLTSDVPRVTRDALQRAAAHRLALWDGTAAGHVDDGSIPVVEECLSVALAENMAAVGFSPPGGVGSTLVFRRQDRHRDDRTSWASLQTLTPPSDPGAEAGAFGRSVAISGNVLVVGAPASVAPRSGDAWESAASASAEERSNGQPGRVHVYRLDPALDRFVPEAFRVFEGPVPGPRFGERVCFDVDLLAIADPGGDGGQGLIEIWRFDDRRRLWDREATILGSEVLDPGTEAFGASLALWGRTLVIAASVAPPVDLLATQAATATGSRPALAGSGAIAFVLERDRTTPFWQLARRLHAAATEVGSARRVTACALSPMGGVLLAGVSEPSVEPTDSGSEAISGGGAATAWHYVLDDDGTPPSFALSLATPTVALGRVVELQVAAATPDVPVLVVYGVGGRGSLTLPSIATSVDLAHPVQIRPGGRADDRGGAALTLTVPPQGRPGPLWLQAVQEGRSSNLVMVHLTAAASPPAVASLETIELVDDAGASRATSTGPQAARPAPPVRSLTDAPALRSLSDR